MRALWGVLGVTLAVACGSDDASGVAGGSGGAALGGAGGSVAGGSAGDSGTGSGGNSSGGSGGADGAAGSAGTATDASADAPTELGDAAIDQNTGTVVLFEQAGQVFTPTASETLKKISFGEAGKVYRRVRVELDVLAGDFQPEVPDEGNPDRTEHILFGLFRAKQTKSDLRYLMGAAAVSFATKSPHFRMFGRSSIGSGYTTYTTWSGTYLWEKGTLYHLDCLLDGISHEQRCELSKAQSVVKSLAGAVAYLDPAQHLSTGFYVELGRAPLGDIETSPIGWVFSNLRVTGDP